ncbi:MAG TPA: response regulator [Burkholderiales bacterium]
MKVFVVEGAPEIRKRLVAMLDRVPGVQVIGEANSIMEAGAALLGNDVQMLLLSLRPMAAGDLRGLARLKRQRPQLRAIVLSNSTSEQYLQAVLAAGADYCLDKNFEFGRVPEILRDWLGQAGSATRA